MLDKQMRENLKISLIMEWYGIRTEDVQEIDQVTYYYISVPESSELKTETDELEKYIRTPEGLVSVAKHMIIKMGVDTYKSMYKDHDDFEDLMKDAEKKVTEFVKIYAKVREGEVWTNEMADARVEELVAKVREASKYQEV